MPGIILTMRYIIHTLIREVQIMKKTTSISIRVSEEELELFKKAAQLESYSTYTEFIRRTALIEAGKIIKRNEERGSSNE